MLDDKTREDLANVLHGLADIVEKLECDEDKGEQRKCSVSELNDVFGVTKRILEKLGSGSDDNETLGDQLIRIEALVENGVKMMADQQSEINELKRKKELEDRLAAESAVEYDKKYQDLNVRAGYLHSQLSDCQAENAKLRGEKVELLYACEKELEKTLKRIYAAANLTWPNSEGPLSPVERLERMFHADRTLARAVLKTVDPQCDTEGLSLSAALLALKDKFHPMYGDSPIVYWDVVRKIGVLLGSLRDSEECSTAKANVVLHDVGSLTNHVYALQRVCNISPGRSKSLVEWLSEVVDKVKELSAGWKEERARWGECNKALMAERADRVATLERLYKAANLMFRPGEVSVEYLERELRRTSEYMKEQSRISDTKVFHLQNELEHFRKSVVQALGLEENTSTKRVKELLSDMQLNRQLNRQLLGAEKGTNKQWEAACVIVAELLSGTSMSLGVLSNDETLASYLTRVAKLAKDRLKGVRAEAKEAAKVDLAPWLTETVPALQDLAKVAGVDFAKQGYAAALEEIKQQYVSLRDEYQRNTSNCHNFDKALDQAIGSIARMVSAEHIPGAALTSLSSIQKALDTYTSGRSSWWYLAEDRIRDLANLAAVDFMQLGFVGALEEIKQRYVSLQNKANEEEAPLRIQMQKIAAALGMQNIGSNVYISPETSVFEGLAYLARYAEFVTKDLASKVGTKAGTVQPESPLNYDVRASEVAERIFKFLAEHRDKLVTQLSGIGIEVSDLAVLARKIAEVCVYGEAGCGWDGEGTHEGDRTDM